jgi:dihydropteroate synthase
MAKLLQEKEASRKREASLLFNTPDTKGIWHCGAYRLNYRKRPRVMGILNVTPDSFSDGGHFFDCSKAVDQAVQMEQGGADIIDIGGESTRPGAQPVSLEEESRRVIPVIEKLAGKLTIPLSIDTTKSAVAKRAIDAGASIVNDVSGFTLDPKMFSIAANGKTGLVIMHTKGTPQTMQRHPRYRNLIEEILLFLSRQVEKAVDHRIPVNRIAIDPGIGFGKTAAHNLKILHDLHRFAGFGLPVMVGPSRKAFIGRILDLPPSERLEGTAAAVAISVFQGANILRVHDVASLTRVIRVADMIQKGGLVS